MKISSEEIISHDTKVSPQSCACLSLSEADKYEWELTEIAIADLVHGDWEPHRPLFTEGRKKPLSIYNHEKMKFLMNEVNRNLSGQDLNYRDDWADEWYARSYAGLDTNPPAILVYKENGYRIRSGRHRVRSLFLRGVLMISAYVGTKK